MDSFTQPKELIWKIKNKPCAIDNHECLYAFFNGEKLSDAAHLTSKGASGKYTEDNIVPLCRFHHGAVQHQKGMCTFIDLYPQFKQLLIELGRTDIITKCEYLEWSASNLKTS